MFEQLHYQSTYISALQRAESVFVGSHVKIPFGKGFALQTVLSLGLGKNDNERNVLNVSPRTVAKSKQKNMEILGGVTLTHTILKNYWLLLRIMVVLRFLRIDVKSLEKEKLVNLIYQSNIIKYENTTNLAGTMGVSLSKVFSFEEGCWSAQITTGYRYDHALKGKTTFTIIVNPLSLSASLPHKTRHSFNIGPSVAVVYKTDLTVHGGIERHFLTNLMPMNL